MDNSQDPTDLSHEVAALVSSIVTRFTSAQRHERSDPWDAALWTELEELDLTTIGVDESHGGAGGTFVDAMAAAFELAKGSCAVPYVETVVGGWLLAASDQPVPQGPFALLLDRELSGAVADDGALVLDGRVPGVGWASVCENLVGVCRSQGRSLVFAVRADQVRISSGANLAGDPHDTVHLDGARTTLFTAVEDSGTGSAASRRLALARAVQIAGAAERALELAVTQGRERTQFGRPIGSFQAIQHHLAIIAEEAELARIGAEAGLGSLDSGPDAEFATAVAKIISGQAATTIAARTHQVLGAIGLTSEFELQRITRRMWAWRDDAGTEADWSQVAGTIVAAAGDEGLWPLLTARDRV
ncbi:acyl-CoA dehydrogenase family protein [Nocardioides houyundeii]|uniref:acyl-CoA dehydrogenase family protein n=1 Tax=Nocardioides houyundeii TaxID=2045452 RepID=UPI000DF1A3A2|nr:acyl-CoA dehydrogenase family protein [Nocardioides houyundeii]